MIKSDKDKVIAIRRLINDKPKNYGGYIENALDIAENLIKSIEDVINDIEYTEDQV